MTVPVELIAWGRVAVRVESAASAVGDRSLVELCRDVRASHGGPRTAGDALRLLRAFDAVFPEELDGVEAMLAAARTAEAQRAQRESGRVQGAGSGGGS